MANNYSFLTVVLIALVVAVVASLITASITGNVIRVKEIKKGTEVYTKAEIDDLIYGVNKNIVVIGRNLVRAKGGSAENDASCNDVCSKDNSECVFGQLALSSDQTDNHKIIDCAEDYSKVYRQYTLNCICNNLLGLS